MSTNVRRDVGAKIGVRGPNIQVASRVRVCLGALAALPSLGTASGWGQALPPRGLGAGGGAGCWRTADCVIYGLALSSVWSPSDRPGVPAAPRPRTRPAVAAYVELDTDPCAKNSLE